MGFFGRIKKAFGGDVQTLEAREKTSRKKERTSKKRSGRQRTRNVQPKNTISEKAILKAIDLALKRAGVQELNRRLQELESGRSDVSSGRPDVRRGRQNVKRKPASIENYNPHGRPDALILRPDVKVGRPGRKNKARMTLWADKTVVRNIKIWAAQNNKTVSWIFESACMNVLLAERSKEMVAKKI